MAIIDEEIGSFLDEMADYGATNDLGTVGTDIFVGDDPGTPDNAIALFGLPGASMSTEERSVKELHYPRFQVYVRNSDYTAGAAQLEAVRNVYHRMIKIWLPHYKVLCCNADTEGGAIGKDEQGRYEFTINFATEYYAGTAPVEP
jgi:hypothetical protein